MPAKHRIGQYAIRASRATRLNRHRGSEKVSELQARLRYTKVSNGAWKGLSNEAAFVAKTCLLGPKWGIFRRKSAQNRRCF